MTRRGLSLLALLTVVAFATLAGFAELRLRADGMGVFDARVLGYGLDEARAYLAALTAEQTVLYKTQFRLGDTAFPALLSLLLLLWFRRRTRGGLRLALTLAVALYLAADYMENMLIGRLLELGPEAITRQSVATASLFTQAKWAIVAICLGAALLLWTRKERTTQ
ncbi:hypothetical protein HTT03_18145 [Sulfitobacter sp. S0837]|uniref:hypothetical protein n=1 Tax=Sulfitobacter maritimus TaxID=2741719 RepID=UPI00158285C1|nr:hypothetical protein [Sulfitobacter maritimus]NUH67211.1 hypothetical protein [Sulfitobacter maritimus]